MLIVVIITLAIWLMVSAEQDAFCAKIGWGRSVECAKWRERKP